jgi:3-dehydroquinate dehydratase/shikimate dehydrogenase
MSTPRLCVTVSAATTAELRARRDAVSDADLIELRLDSVRDPDVAAALAGRRRPVVVTCRPTWEGGRFEGPEEARATLLSDALAIGAEYIDVEWRAGFVDDLLTRTGGRRVVLSVHDFECVPADLDAQLRAMLATRAEVVKVAAHVNRLADCVRLRDAARTGGDGRVAVIAMGAYGTATRVLASRFGSPWAYAGSRQEVGQLTAESMLTDYRFRSLTDSTAIYGIVGGSVAHSVSPAMHNAGFEAAGIDAVYLPLPAVDADDFVTFGRALGISGASITIPHKTTLFDHLDEVDETARRIGAINTVRVVNGRWIGTNTDAAGFLAPLGGHLVLNGMRVAVLGAGGAGRRSKSRHGRRSLGVGICWSTAPRSACIHALTTRPYPRVSSRATRCTTWSTTRRPRVCCARRPRPAVRRSTASTCSSLKRRSSFCGGPARGRHQV